MERSEAINDLATALGQFQKDCPPIPMTASNPFFKSRYADLVTIMHTVSPVLSKHGLAVSQVLEGQGAVTTVLSHKSGQFLAGTLTIEPSKRDPQGYGSAITYARRYAVLGILGLVGDPDDDGNEASKPTAETKQAVEEARKPSKITKQQKDELARMVKEFKIPTKDISEVIHKRYGREGSQDLTVEEAQDLVGIVRINHGAFVPFDYEPYKEDK